jgi:hypothetical protein
MEVIDFTNNGTRFIEFYPKQMKSLLREDSQIPILNRPDETASYYAIHYIHEYNKKLSNGERRLILVNAEFV